MVYSSLPTVYQNVIFEQHSYILKWFVFLLLVFFSCYYLFVVWKNHEETKFYTVMAFRFYLGALSVGNLVAIPFTVLLMTPEYSFHSFYLILLLLYKIAIYLGVTMFLVDLMRYGFTGMLRFSGVKIGDSNTDEIVRSIENNKHFFKLVKRGKK